MKSKKYLCIILAAMLLTASFVFAIPANAYIVTYQYFERDGIVDIEARVSVTTNYAFLYNYAGMYMSQGDTLFDLHWQGVVTRQTHTDIESYISAYTFTPVSGRDADWSYTSQSYSQNDLYGRVIAVEVVSQ